MAEEVRSDKMPSGIPYIIGNEMAERFSYYGMKTILTIFMTEYLLDAAGNKAPMSSEESKVWFHTFGIGIYFIPFFGALLADIFWGKYKTILTLSIVYCLGHLALSLDDTRFGLAIGLSLIAIGSGGIKPCVSANVGDQFTESNKHLIAKVFNYFYLAINLGAMISTLLTPLLLKHLGASVAFGVPGALMLIATFIFWLGKRKYRVIPPVGLEYYKREVFTKEGWRAISGLLLLFFCIAFFWSLYEQTGSSWVLQAKHALVIKDIDLSFGLESLRFLTFSLLPDQLQAANPILVLIFVPLFTLVLYPAIDKVYKLTALRKISIGLFITAVSFGIVAWIQFNISQGIAMSIVWQLLAYMVLTAAEVMVYGTGLEFAYRQAPAAMKAVVMSLFMLSVSLGNLITVIINAAIMDENGKSVFTDLQYYLFFVAMMLVVAVAFIFVAKGYKEKDYAQG